MLVWTRHGCGLCEAGVRTAREVAGAAGEPVDVRDVDAADDAVRREHSDWVPVVLVDGVVVDSLRVDPERVRAALAVGARRPVNARAAASRSPDRPRRPAPGTRR